MARAYYCGTCTRARHIAHATASPAPAPSYLPLPRFTLSCCSSLLPCRCPCPPLNDDDDDDDDTNENAPEQAFAPFPPEGIDRDTMSSLPKNLPGGPCPFEAVLAFCVPARMLRPVNMATLGRAVSTTHARTRRKASP